MSGSRLERIIKLLESASSPSFRSLAAKQIGEIVQSQPSLARSIINQLEPLLYSESWDTRIATGQALNLVFSHLPDSYDLNPSISAIESGLLMEIDIAAEIKSRKPLLASGGVEFDLDLTISAAERLKIGRKNLKKTLGLDEVADMELLAKELVQDEDLTAADGFCKKVEVESVDLEKLSARERSAMKRKARMASKSTAPVKQVKLETTSSDSLSTQKSVIDYINEIKSDSGWFCERMKENLLNPKWNIRHGALLGLKAAVSHGIPKTFEDETAGNWLDFLIADILLLLGLDRFYDFVGDAAIAPVKETAAQVFALLFKHLSDTPAAQVQIINRHISTLLSSQVWQIQHSGLLAAKYIVGAADPSLLESVSKALGDAILSLLAAEDEDIRAVAAEVIGFLVSCDKLDLDRIENSLHEVFLSIAANQDGSSNVSSLLQLLETVLKKKPKLSFSPAELLLQFLRSPSSAIRMQVVKLLELLGPLDSEFLVQLIQSMAVELDPSIMDRTFGLFEANRAVIDSSKVESLLAIASCPIGVPYQKEWFSFRFPSIHDLGFKKADMMVIKEHEALCQRMNVARALKGLVPVDSLKGLASSAVNLHHLVYCWIGGEKLESYRPQLLFAEEQPLWNELVMEVKVPASMSLVDLRARISALPQDQASVIKSLLSRFEANHALLLARSEASLTRGLESLLKLLTLESQPVLQEFFAKKLVELCDKFPSDLFDQLGDFCDMKELIPDSTGFIHAQPTWKAYDSGSDRWRSGRFIFKELANVLIFFESSSPSMNSLAAYLAQCQRLPFKGLFDLLSANFASEDSFVVAQSAFIFAHAVRVDTSFAFLDEFVASLLFSAPVSVALGIVLELIYRADEVILPVLPVFLKRAMHFINDPSPNTRQYASLAFSELIRIAPLSDAKFDLSALPARLSDEIASSREFLSQLQGPSSNLLDFKPPCPINAELRPYQQEGLNWLAFLRRFDLHGALCDDMGLGKTLQTLCILASDHFEAKAANRIVQSLIICPPSLCGHWEAEIKNYCPSLTESAQSVFVYSGTASERRGQFAASIQGAEVIVTSYDVIRSDVELFAKIEWNYCILDEGHLIKNPKTKLAAAIKSLSTRRRLLLSGTPIQNNLLELWSLFDFLMPGYLGEEKEFASAFAKPIAVAQYQQAIASSASSNIPHGSLAKWTSRDLDEAESKLASLHKQVLPFIMRRMKEDVLKDLPPKIIQDLTAEMSPIQRIIYEDLLASSAIKSEISQFVSTNEAVASETPKNQHIFRVLQYLRKLCVHPKLIMEASHPLSSRIEAELAARNLSLDDLAIAPKFQMLKELLFECGLGDADSRGLASNHRVLIFAQQKSTLDLVERLVFQAHLPNLTYLRLDGDVPPPARFPIVSQFNSDPTVDVLLLTTHVGGLGLNLTAADMVIFMDPDWNPMKDLQAMDRAHRLGQKRTVNVYRLLLKDTLEERIMGLQRWKLHVANTVVSQQNSSMKSMDTGVIMDLFEASTSTKTSEDNKTGKTDTEPSATAKWLKEHGVVEAEEGEDTSSQYEKEFDLQSFATDTKKQ